MKKKSKSSSKKSNGILKYLSKNYWAISTILLSLLIVGMFVSTSINSTVIGTEKVGQRVVDFAKNQGVEAELIEVNEQGELYEVVISIDGQEVPVYATRDGKNLISQLIPLEEEKEEPAQTESTTAPSSDNPVSRLYIWSYCPYGVTALSPFAQVAKLLGGDFKVVLYYAGHGDFEVQQNKIQACIQHLGYTEYWDYAETFANEIYEECYGDIDCDLEKSVELMKSLGINSEKVMACVETSGDALLEADYNAAKAVGVTGSPSLVVNDAILSVSRTAEAYKAAICSAYNEAPSECGETLDSAAAEVAGSC